MVYYILRGMAEELEKMNSLKETELQIKNEIAEELRRANDLKETELQIKKDQHKELIKTINNFVVM